MIYILYLILQHYDHRNIFHLCNQLKNKYCFADVVALVFILRPYLSSTSSLKGVTGWYQEMPSRKVESGLRSPELGYTVNIELDGFHPN
jgi:hypothetical protein